MNSFVNRYIKFSIAIAIIVSPLLLFFNNFKNLIAGLFFGLAIRLLLFKVSAIDLDKTLSMTVERAKRFGRLNYFKRFLFYAAALSVSAKSPYLNIYTCAIGLVILSWSIHLLNIIDIYKSNKSNQNWF